MVIKNNNMERYMREKSSGRIVNTNKYKNMETNKVKSKFPNVGEPSEDKIVVLQEGAEERTEGGIIIPDNVQEKPERGIVIAVGKRSDGKPSNLKPGDVILFGKYSGTLVRLKAVEYLIMSYKDYLIKIPK
jgi:chaperonin GroES